MTTITIQEGDGKPMTLRVFGPFDANAEPGRWFAGKPEHWQTRRTIPASAARAAGRTLTRRTRPIASGAMRRAIDERPVRNPDC